MDKKNYNHITFEQRIKIEALLKAGHKVSFISEQLNAATWSSIPLSEWSIANGWTDRNT